MLTINGSKKQVKQLLKANGIQAPTGNHMVYKAEFLNVTADGFELLLGDDVFKFDKNWNQIVETIEEEVSVEDGDDAVTANNNNKEDNTMNENTNAQVQVNNTTTQKEEGTMKKFEEMTNEELKNLYDGVKKMDKTALQAVCTANGIGFKSKDRKDILIDAIQTGIKAVHTSRVPKTQNVSAPIPTQVLQTPVTPTKVQNTPAQTVVQAPVQNPQASTQTQQAPVQQQVQAPAQNTTQVQQAEDPMVADIKAQCKLVDNDTAVTNLVKLMEKDVVKNLNVFSFGEMHNLVSKAKYAITMKQMRVVCDDNGYKKFLAVVDMITDKAVADNVVTVTWKKDENGKNVRTYSLVITDAQLQEALNTALGQATQVVTPANQQQAPANDDEKAQIMNGLDKLTKEGKQTLLKAMNLMLSGNVEYLTVYGLIDNAVAYFEAQQQ